MKIKKTLSGLSKVFAVFKAKERFALGGFLMFMLISSFLEVISIAIVYPYIALITDPGLLMKNPRVTPVYEFFNFTSPKEFLVLISIALPLVFIVKHAFVVGLNFFYQYFVHRKIEETSQAQIDFYYHRPYSYFLKTNSSQILRMLTWDIPMFFNGIIIPILSATAEILTLLFILIFLFFINPISSLSSAAIVGIMIFLFYFVTGRRIARWGKEAQEQYANMYQHTNQFAGGIKEIKVLRCGDYFNEQFIKSLVPYNKASLWNSIMGQLSRPYFEIVMIMAMVGVVIAFLFLGGALHKITPLLAVYALAGIRTLPSVGKITSAVSSLKYCLPSARLVVNEIRERRVKRKKDQRKHTSSKESKKISLKEELKIENLEFRYPGQKAPLFENLNLSIKKGESVALIGYSGSGKSTLVDIVLGLLKPVQGGVFVDGVDINKNRDAWQRQIGYVPQHIYLADDTLAKNIALGVHDHELDLEKINEVVRMAKLEEMVEELPEGVNTFLGERGVRLSGGQRQRIGIARALYRSPQFLIFDEATSSLDGVTEARIVDAIRSLKGEKTILLVAHRLTTVRYCEKICLMEGGQIIDSGTYDEICERHQKFINPHREKKTES